ncbi:MAG: hypoxanthine-guanine phosphoribosyltransferase [Nitrosomonas sp.]|nr:hypoxanthine-guanine phosphoribosyltransferase [Nitrosomonas sp.]MDP1951825.1 hypoxanthine-guanine phosphoribosyltransferase [Nitrosomonas sp.]
MLSKEEAEHVLATAEQIYSAAIVAETINQMAVKITRELAEQYPLVLCVMGGAVVFTGHLLPLLEFPLNFDYLHVTRYNNTTQGGQIRWKVAPRENLAGRVVLVLDDLLDEGITLAAIQKKVMACGAKAFYSAVLADKDIGQPKPFHADFVGLTLPNRYVFGFGMDVQGAWRNLPAIYAIKK